VGLCPPSYIVTSGLGLGRAYNLFVAVVPENVLNRPSLEEEGASIYAAQGGIIFLDPFMPQHTVS
jgi:hypothetical protein